MIFFNTTFKNISIPSRWSVYLSEKSMYINENYWLVSYNKPDYIITADSNAPS